MGNVIPTVDVSAYEEAMRRARILTKTGTSPSQHDAAVALGYEPESWDGMWKLPAGYPITWITRNWAIVREVSYQPGTHRARFTRRGRVKTRLVLKRAVR